MPGLPPDPLTVLDDGTRERPRRRVLAVVAAVLVTVAASSCAGSSDEGASPTAVSTASDGSTFNQADVDFATDMIQHHAQAVQMVVIAQGRDLDAPVAAVMEQVRTAQVPEIETMSDWLTAWDEPIPATSLDHANAGHDMDDLSSGMDDGELGDLPGMMSADQMGALEDASGAGSQDLWLQMMSAHHEGAVAMARVEMQDGAHGEAVDLATSIVESQGAQLDTMAGLLG